MCTPCLCIWNMRSNSISIRSFCIPYTVQWYLVALTWAAKSNWAGRMNAERHPQFIHTKWEWANSVGCVTVHGTTWHTRHHINSWWQRRWVEQIYIYLFRCFAEFPESFQDLLRDRSMQQTDVVLLPVATRMCLLNELMPRSDKRRRLV